MKQLTSRNSHKQGGFTMVELIIVISVSAVLAYYAIATLKQDSEETIARAAGSHISMVANAAQLHVLNNFDAYANSTAVPGIASLLQPTVAELRTLGRLPNTWPLLTPTRQALQIDVSQAGCPGPTCLLRVLACTTTPVTLGGTVTRFDLASTMVSSQNGTGGQSLVGNGALIRGPLLSPGAPNPIAGTPEGIVCGSSSIDLSLYQLFVKIRDVRDPDLQGDLSVAGKVNAKTTLDVGTCINMDGTAAGQGRAGFGCTDRDDLPAGYTGGVRSPDVVGSGNILTSSNPASFTGSNTNYAILTTNNGTGSAEIRTSGRTAGDRLTPLGSYAPGTACAAADEGSLARNSAATGLVTCESSVWVAMKKTGVVNQPCSPDGAIGTSPGGLALYCQSGIWTLLADRFGRFAIVDTYLVYDHTRGLNPVIPVPACPASGVPKIYFNPQGIDARSGAKTNFRADITTSPGNYTIHVDDTVNPLDPAGTPVAGYGLLTVGCFYN